jgi:DNA-binding HxlR family transcriptional regulator/putative sterol carrier protein
MPREYGQFCGLAQALDVVGGRWSLLIVRDLLNGPKRFKDLEDGLPGIPTNVLSARLKELETSGVVRRHLLPRPAKGVGYELTDYGRELEAPLVALGLWGARSLGRPSEGDPISVDGLALALRGAFRPGEAAGLRRTYELQLDGRSLLISVEGGTVSIVSAAGPSDVRLATSAEVLVALLFGQLRVDDALTGGQLSVAGGKTEARRFFKLFRLDLRSPAPSVF